MNDLTHAEPMVPVHVTNLHEITGAITGAVKGGDAQPPVAGYPRGTWQVFSAPLAGQGVKPAQLLQSDERRGRAVIISIDQDLFIASTEAELLQGPSQAAPQGGYWPKQVPLEIKDSDPLYALAVATGASKVTVHAESTAG